MDSLIAAIDQGTTSTRCLIFNRATEIVGSAQVEHGQIYPRPGWVEHDPREIWRNTEQVIREAVGQINGKGQIAAVGITNQRETIVFWNRRTGEPYGNAIVWQDTRTHDLCDELGKEGGPDRFRAATGLPLATYFSGPKIKWALELVDGLKEAVHSGEAICGTIDSWLIWNLTGQTQDGKFVTDITNASRTQLMNLHTLQWDEEILEIMGIPVSMLPRIAPSSDPDAFGTTRPDGPFGAAIPICGVVGDQQAALLGQCCFNAGEAKCTYGTGCFLLLNTGETPVKSSHGLLTTLGYQFAGEKPVYALEGSVAIAGALVQWLRDNLGLIETAPGIETLARTVDDSGGCYIVPAFSGLFAPHWRSDARGVMVGLTRFINKGHIARAALEATCFQTREVLEAMREDAGLNLQQFKVDGGMVVNDLLMQFQSDMLDLPVVRPRMTETTALGAAFAAGLAIGMFSDLAELRNCWREDRRWEPQMDAMNRERLYAGWLKAVERTLNWVD